MDLNKHIATNNNRTTYHHSSGFAEIANSNHFGATANISFQQRCHIDRNRQAIQNYHRSTIGNPRGVLRAKPIHIANRMEIGHSVPRPAPIPLRRYDPYK